MALPIPVRYRHKHTWIYKYRGDPSRFIWRIAISPSPRLASTCKWHSSHFRTNLWHGIWRERQRAKNASEKPRTLLLFHPTQSQVKYHTHTQVILKVMHATNWISLNSSWRLHLNTHYIVGDSKQNKKISRAEFIIWICWSELIRSSLAYLFGHNTFSISLNRNILAPPYFMCQMNCFAAHRFARNSSCHRLIKTHTHVMYERA